MTEPAPSFETTERQLILPPPLWDAVVGFLKESGFGVAQIPNLEDPIPTYSVFPARAEEP